MTSDLAIGRRVGGSVRSVRQRVAAIPRVERWLGILLLGAVAIHGARALAPFYVRGDLLYHWGLTNTILLGTFPAEGPYAGLPAYYPPGFHLLLAGIAGLLRTDAPTATAVLGLLWLPVIPLGTYLLTRRLTGRRDVALLAATLTAFAGGFDLSADRLWVNSMFMVGQAFYPVYPRDLVFGLLPFAVLAFLRATDEGSRAVAWAALAGILLGVCGLLQVQLLIPIPVTLAFLVVMLGLRHEGRWRRLIGVLAVTGVIAAGMVAPWLAWLVGTIRANGGVSIDSSEDLLPVRIGFWQYPIQFGLVLPLTIIGVGVALSFLRRSSGPAPADDPSGWAPRPLVAPLLLVPWWLIPFSLAAMYQPSWPLEDALRPQRMWMVSSQPGLILAAIGLVALVEVARRRWPERRRLTTAALAATVLVAAVPTTVATERLLWNLWTFPRYAHLDLTTDRVPDMAELLTVTGPRPTILTYEDWSSLVWYGTGASVVAVEPPGYAKLAFDPGGLHRRRPGGAPEGPRQCPDRRCRRDDRGGRQVRRGSDRARTAGWTGGEHQPRGRAGGRPARGDDRLHARPAGQRLGRGRAGTRVEPRRSRSRVRESRSSWRSASCPGSAPSQATRAQAAPATANCSTASSHRLRRPRAPWPGRHACRATSPGPRGRSRRG